MKNLSLLIDILIKKSIIISVAESCTGGLLSAAITDIPGSSAFFDRGFVTYSNDAKIAMVGVADSLIKHEGAVSEQVARAMAEGAITHSNSHLSASITGIAGPGGGTSEKPVGTVHIAVNYVHMGQERTIHHKYHFSGDRNSIRIQSCNAAIDMMLQLVR